MDSTVSAPFDPAVWLSEFIAVGGAYMSNGDKIAFCWAIYGWSMEDNVRCRELYRIIEASTAKMDAVTSHLNAQMLQEVEP